MAGIGEAGSDVVVASSENETRLTPPPTVPLSDPTTPPADVVPFRTHIRGTSTPTIAFHSDDDAAETASATPPRSPKSLQFQAVSALLGQPQQKLSLDEPLEATDAFKAEVKRLTRTNYKKQDFILFQQLDHWMRRTGAERSRPDYSNLDLILAESYRYHGGPSLTKIRQNIRLSSSRSVFRLFCILLQIDAGHLIEPLSFGLSDSDLPLSRDALQAELQRASGILSGPHDVHRYVEGFLGWQAAFCCKALEKHKGIVFGKQEVVPFTKMVRLDNKDDGICRIEVPADFVSAEIQQSSRGPRHELDGELYFEFVVKPFDAGKELDGLLRETDLYANIPGTLRLFSVFEVSSVSSSRHYLLFESDDFDLAEFMQSHKSPILFQDVFDLWKSLSSVAETVRAMHQLDTSSLDIQPENIVWVGDSWKLVPWASSKRRPGLVSAYVAPEVSSGSGEQYTSSGDIWSLGAILSTVATWVVLGAEGVAQFSKARQAAILDLTTRPSVSGQYLDGCFHDGVDVLPEVTAWHELLHYSVRRSDHLTSKILSLVDQGMLNADANLRHSAGKITELYNELLAAVESNPSAEFEPPGSLWTRHRSLIAEAGLDSPEIIQAETPAPEALARLKRARLPIKPVRGRPEKARTPLGSPDRLGYTASRDRSVAPEPFPGIGKDLSRPQTPTSVTLDPQYNMSWARKTLQLDQRRVRSPSRSLMTFAAKTFGIKAKHGDELLAQFYKDRYLVFLVDNGSSMVKHWTEATMLLETLVSLTKGLDSIRNIDLRFTFQSPGLSQERHTRQFVKMMESARPKAAFQVGSEAKEKVNLPGEIHTDMASALSELFAEYKQKMKKTRGFTLIVLTDGLWIKEDRGEVRDEIAKFAAQFGLPFPRHRPFGVEFVRFGDDVEAKQKLEYLDERNTADYLGRGDVVDTEPWTGSVYKMLLGSFVEAVDNDKREVARPPTSGFRDNNEEFDPDSD